FVQGYNKLVCLDLHNISGKHDSDDKSIPYRDYRTAGGDYAKWSITPDLSELPYWKWFV
ncbi:hypothetical protein M9458_042946, partial [Cirrhinus mrigala]